MPIRIDLSNGWDSKEIDKLIKALPCSDEDKKIMGHANEHLSAEGEG